MWWCTFHQMFTLKTEWFSFHSQKLLKWSYISNESDEIVVKKGDCIGGFSSRKNFHHWAWSVKQGGKFHPIQQFYWGEPWAVNLNFISIPSCLQALSKSTFSLALFQCRHQTWIPYLGFNFLIRPNITSFVWTFLSKYNSMHNPYYLFYPIANVSHL